MKRVDLFSNKSIEPEPNKRDKKAQKILLKEHETAKKIIQNMQQALNGLNYIQEIIKDDPKAQERIKESLVLVSEIFNNQ